MRSIDYERYILYTVLHAPGHLPTSNVNLSLLIIDIQKGEKKICPFPSVYLSHLFSTHLK